MGNCLWGDNEGDDDAIKESTGHESMHQGMLRERNLDVYKKYEEFEVLGQGSMGHVARVRIRNGAEGGSAFAPNQKSKVKNASSHSTLSERRSNKVDYALKSIILDRVSPDFLTELRNEIDILKGLDHPNIVKAYEVYTYKKQIYIVMELCDGGDLYTRLPYSEKQAANITSQLMSAVQYMHANGVSHRDLKFENLILQNFPSGDDSGFVVKVIDFGLSKKFLNNKVGVMHEGVGTLYSMSPQVLQGVYTSQADLWSCGVIAYMLLSSHRPFYHRRRKIMIDRIMRADFTFEKDYWKPISKEAKDFVSKLLVLNPKERMDAEQALKHIWLSKEFKLSDRIPDQTTADAVQGNLIHYKNTSQLKKIALNVIAHKSSTAEIMELRKVFDQFDTANNGVISFEEFQAAVKKMNYDEKDIQDMFKSIDVNKNGHLMYTEFLAATLEAQGHIEEERVADAFDRLDSDDSGFISRQNLRDFLGKDGTTEKINKIMMEGDTDGDGKISYTEFLDLFRKETASMVNQLRMESTLSDDDNLVGLDAKIPGGRFDSSA